MTAVACVGIAVLDIVFSVDELPSAAGKYYAREYREIGGGVAANAAATVAALGGHARYVGRIGDDAVGERILAELRAWDVDTAHVEQVVGCGSSVSAVFVDRTGERLIVNHVDPRLFGDGARLDESALGGVDAVLVDTRWPDGAEAALSMTTARGAPAVLDCDRAPVSEGDRLLKAASHVVFSETALTELAGVDVLDTALRQAARRTDAWLAVTAGADGVFWLDAGDVRHLPAFPVKVVDTLAAGDVFHGAFALALAEKKPVESALEFASAVAALKCTRFGGRAGIPTRAEVEAFMKRSG